MSRETIGTSIPRKVSLRREDSGYNSNLGTPAGTPCVMNGRRISRAEPRDCPPLQGIEEEGTPGSCPAPSFYNRAAHQLSVPDEEEKSTRSAPMPYGGLSAPSLTRALSLEAGYYSNGYVSKKAEQIISRFEKMRMDSNESVCTQSPSPVEQLEEQFEEQPKEKDDIQYPVLAVPPMVEMQRQFSEFPLDKSVLTLGQDGYYLEDRDYNIVREAGSGGSACCRLGNDNKKSTQFVIKKPKKSFSEEEKQDMMRESRILKEIDHDNVIRFYGLVEDMVDHCFKIFLEYADETCGDIHYLFCESDDKDNFSGNIALIMLYVQQMLFAVDHLHSVTGILHLDIKGKNIVVCNGGYRVKLIDFGTACKANGALRQNGGWTPVFAAPEVNNQSDSPKFSADIWSVMCVAVEMVTGALPWPKVTSDHEAVLKIGQYRDEQISELVEHDMYWDKYSIYYQEHHDMYQELVYMWKRVFHRDSASRPSAHYLLNLKWMKEMELNGESILYGLVGGEDQPEQPCIEESYPMDNENVGIMISHSPVQYYPQEYEDNLSDHSFSQPGCGSPYRSNSPHLQTYPPNAGHSSAGSDGEAYCDFSSSFSGRNTAYLSEPRFPASGPSSLPAQGTTYYGNPTSYDYHHQSTSTPVPSSNTPQFIRLDSTDGRDNLSSSRARSRSYSMQTKPPDIEQLTAAGDKRRKSLCYIGTSKSEPINVLNASGIMDSINKASVKRVNSLTYVMEGPKTDSPVSSPRIENQSLVPGLVKEMISQQSPPPCHRTSSSDVGTPTSSVTDSGYGGSFKERFIKRSVSVDQSSLQSSSRSSISLPDRDEHKPDGCSEPSETIPHTIQLSSPTSNKSQQIEVKGTTTVNEIMKMTQNASKSSDKIILKLQ